MTTRLDVKAADPGHAPSLRFKRAGMAGAQPSPISQRFYVPPPAAAALEAIAAELDGALKDLGIELRSLARLEARGGIGGFDN